MEYHAFKPKSIAKILIKNKYMTKDNFVTLSLADKDGNKGYIYQKICLENFPSFKDYFGYKTIVSEGESTIIDFINGELKIIREGSVSKKEIEDIL